LFNPDNRLIATGSENAIRLVDVIDGSHVRTLEPCNNLLVLYTSGDVGHAELSQVTSVAFDPNGRWLASACDGDAAVTLWDVTTGRPIRRIPALPAPAGSYCMSSGRPPPCLGGEPPLSRPDGLLAMAVSPDGQWLATGARDRTMRVWDLATGRLLLERGGHSNAIDSLTFSTDSRFLASSDHSTATLWQLPNGTAVRQTPAHATVAIGPDQRWLTATYDNYRMTIKVWNIAAGKDEASVPSQEQSAAVLSPDGRFLIAPQRGAPTLIDMATREATAMVDATPATWRLAFSPDGRWAALQPFFLFRLPPAPATAAARVTDRREQATRSSAPTGECSPVAATIASAAARPATVAPSASGRHPADACSRRCRALGRRGLP
jgi:WD40 repeat protein